MSLFSGERHDLTKTMISLACALFAVFDAPKAGLANWFVQRLDWIHEYGSVLELVSSPVASVRQGISLGRLVFAVAPRDDDEQQQADEEEDDELTAPTTASSTDQKTAQRCASCKSRRPELCQGCRR